MTEGDLAARAAPRRVFYPLFWGQGPLFLKAGADIAPLMTPQTLSVHLWNATLSKYMNRIERGSPIDRLLSEGTLFDEARLRTA